MNDVSPVTKMTSKKVSRVYSPKTIKILFGFSGNRCAMPSCSNRIVNPATEYSLDAVVGQISHIYAAADNGPRGKPDLTEKERNSPDNLILLCPTHHVEVDEQYETYPAPLLKDWKEHRERPQREQISNRIAEVGYKELELAAETLMSTTPAEAGGLEAIPPPEKIKKNGLGQASRNLLVMGAAKSKECDELIVKTSQLHPLFGQKLRVGFTTQYDKLRSEGLAGDDLFMGMYDWAAGNTGDKIREAAGLCVLSHLFVVCDVFEK